MAEGNDTRMRRAERSSRRVPVGGVQYSTAGLVSVRAGGREAGGTA